MKKILLVATVALFALSASAQGLSAQKSGKAMMQNQPKAASEVMHAKFQVAPAKAVKPMAVNNLLSKALDAKALDAVVLAPASTAAVQDMYNAKGTSMETNEQESWEMYSGKFNDGTDALVDVIPDPFGFEDGVAVEVSIEGNSITIDPQLVASAKDGSMYVYLLDASADFITLDMDAAGNITGRYNILYGAFSVEDPNDFDHYLGYYSYYSSISYAVPGAAAVAPAVSFEPANLQLFAGLGISGYSYNANLSMISAYAPFTFHNNTVDDATEWQWTVTENEENELHAKTKDLVLETEGGNAYSNTTLVGINQTATSEPFVWGAQWLTEDPYEACYMYAGGTESEFEFTDGTTATLGRFNPDGDLTFYTNWATPDRASNSMSKIYMYQGKPASPLYIEGVTVPVVGGLFNPDFNLHLVIAKCERKAGKLQIGDVIAQADASVETVNEEYAGQSGLSAINFTELYVEDEDGMSEDIDHLFIEDEFVLILEGWDNGTFQAVPGCADLYDENSDISVWFEMTGEEGSMYRYTSWKTQLWSGFLGAAYGYLYTEDNTTLEIPAEGGQASIHINPMLCSIDDSGNQVTRLMLEDEDAVPEWLSVGVANESYGDEFAFDLVVEAEAGDAAKATFTVFQEGAKLDITVIRGEAAGINSVAVKNNNAQIYNLMGQKVEKANAGIYVQNGVKFIAK